MLEAALHKTVAVRPPTFHLTNHTSKISLGNTGKGRIRKQRSRSKLLCLQNLHVLNGNSKIVMGVNIKFYIVFAIFFPLPE